MTMNVDLGKHYEKIIEKAIYKGRAITKVDALRQALTQYDATLEEIEPTKQDLMDIAKARKEYSQGKYVTEEELNKILKTKKR